MLPLWLALTLPLAHAHDADRDGQCSEVAAADAPKAVPERDPLRFQASALQSTYGAPWLAGQFRVVGRKDAYVGVEGRVGSDASWTARVGLGFDLLGKSDWDLKLGLFLGGLGDGWVRDPALVTGTEIGVGARIGRLYGQYRWLFGLGSRHPEAVSLHTEQELIVGFRLVKELRVFGQAVFTGASDRPGATALGLGVALRM